MFERHSACRNSVNASDIYVMSFEEEVNKFIPTGELLEKFMFNMSVPDYAKNGSNSNIEYAIMFTSMLKYSFSDNFYSKLVSLVETYYSNTHDVQLFASPIYRESMSFSVDQWESCMNRYAGTLNIFQGGAVMKADIFGGIWAGVGYMDYYSTIRRLSAVIAEMKNSNMFYEGTDMVNVDVLKNVGDCLQVLHNVSALYDEKLDVKAAFSQDSMKRYRGLPSGGVNFDSMVTPDLQKFTKVVANWSMGKGSTHDELVGRLSVELEKVSPDELWGLMSCGVEHGYEKYAGLSKAYIKAMFK